MIELRYGRSHFPDVWQFVCEQKHALFMAGHATFSTIDRPFDKEVISLVDIKDVAAESEVVAVLVFEHHARSHTILIDLLAVAEKYRGMGHAKALIEALAPHMEHHEATRIEAVVSQDNEVMIALCEAMGYEPDYVVFSKVF